MTNIDPTFDQPVFDKNQRVIAAINCSTTTSRAVPKEFEAGHLPLLREAASHIEWSLLQFPSLVHALQD